MLTEYNKTTYTHHYIMGVRLKELIVAYFIDLDLEGLEKLFTSLTTSRNTKVIRYSSTKAKIEYLNTHCIKSVVLCDSDSFENSRRIKTNRFGKQYVENRGEYFEYLVAQAFGGIQNEMSNLKHTEGGDIEINGTAYQVKFEGAGIYVGKR